MDLWILVGGTLLFLLLLFLLWKNQRSVKMLQHATDELKFFKKEKEYHDEAMFLLSKDFTIIYANKVTKDLFSLDENNEIQGITKNIQLQISNDISEDFFSTLYEYSNKFERSFRLNDVLLFVSGQEQKVNIFLDKSASNINGTMTCIIDLNPVSTKVNDKERSQDGVVDFLTGLPSQFQASTEINSLVIDSKKKSEFFGIFLMGIDHFLDIQTTLGLGYTNKILKRVSQYFMDNPNENIHLYRMDADKFLFVINGLDEDKLARTMAKDLIVTVDNIFRDSNDIRLTSSVGVVLYPRDGENATKLIDNVYIALDKAQQGSESNIEIFTVGDSIIHTDDVHMNDEIKKGLIKSEFLLFYQPIFDLKGEQMIGAEALLRWEHPRYGLISADKFLKVAEKTGLIVDLGEYAFNEAIQQRQRCETKTMHDFQITINLSLKEMQVNQLLSRLEMLFSKYGIERNMINLDISEHVAMQNIDKTANDFRLLKDFGLSLSLDNFGAGYSSFKYLNMLPIDMIKIDRSLIFDLTLNLKHQTTVKAIIELAHTLGYKVIAEGVETSQESSILTALNCDYAQGYLYSRPLPAKEFEALLN